MMDALFLVGRVFFATVFVITPLQVVRSAPQIATAPPLRPVPFPELAVRAVAIIAIAGATLVILGVWPDLGVILIAAFLVPVSVVMHPFWSVEDADTARQKRDSFLLNLSVLGGGLILFWLVNQTQEVPAGLISTPLFPAF